jgi:hypothetical protein
MRYDAMLFQNITYAILAGALPTVARRFDRAIRTHVVG